jgi:hypothetical protein
MAGASDVSIRRAATRALKVQQCFAEHTVVGSDVSILRVATRVLEVQHCCAWDTAAATDDNCEGVVTRVLVAYFCFTSHGGGSRWRNQSGCCTVVHRGGMCKSHSAAEVGLRWDLNLLICIGGRLIWREVGLFVRGDSAWFGLGVWSCWLGSFDSH